jgi:hypothetical protein
MRYTLPFLLIMPHLILADPWGKDADLVNYCPPVDCENSCVIVRQSPLAGIGETLIQFHQDVISPIDGPRSHFIPSSSQYTKEAMLKYGFFWGVAYGCDRLMRENDEEWVYEKVQGEYGFLKYDPVR